MSTAKITDLPADNLLQILYVYSTVFLFAGISTRISPFDFFVQSVCDRIVLHWYAEGSEAGSGARPSS